MRSVLGRFTHAPEDFLLLFYYYFDRGEAGTFVGAVAERLTG